MTKALMQRRESTRYPGYFVKKYTRTVFFDNLWHENPEFVEARGHVEDADGNIVIRPFTKIFNRFENGTDMDGDDTVLVVEKKNGFMCAATYVPALDVVMVSTTGSLDSDFVKVAEKWITDDIKKKIKLATEDDPVTYLFEICDPSDPHIIPETPGAYLIGARRVADERPYFSDVSLEVALDFIADRLGVLRPWHTVMKFDELIPTVRDCKHEGYVVYGLGTKKVLKIKSPYYLTMKFVSRMRDEKFAKWLADGTIKQKVDEEFYPLVEYLKLIDIVFLGKTEQEKLAIVREFLTNKVE